MRERSSLVKSMGKIILETRNSTYKDLKVGMGLVLLRNRMLPQDSEPKARVVENKIDRHAGATPLRDW